jgi:hypothetical protein
MSYIVNYSTSTKSPIIINTATVDNSTSLNLIGKNVSGFGELLAENFLHILENFASSVEPLSPIEGQLWYDTSDINKKVLKVKAGVGSDWRPVSNIYFQTTEPASAISGEIWIKYEDENLSFYTYVSGTGWINLAAVTTIISTNTPTETDRGRLWFSPTNQNLYIYTGTWTRVLSPAIYSSSTPTENAVTGQIWYNSSNNIPFLYNGSSWIELVSVVTNLNTEGDVNFDGGNFTFNSSNQNKDARFAGISDNNLLFTDASTNRVGIGTNNPRTKLDVVGTITATNIIVGTPISVSSGGTGLGSITTGSILKGNGTNTVSPISADLGKIYNVLSIIPTSLTDAEWSERDIFANNTETRARTSTILAVTPVGLRYTNRKSVEFSAISTTATNVTFSIPDWVSVIHLNFIGVKITSGTTTLVLQLQYDNVTINSGYIASTNGTLVTQGFSLATGVTSSYTYYGSVRIELVGGNYVYSAIFNRDDGVIYTSSGMSPGRGSSDLTNIRITTLAGSIFGEGPPGEFNYSAE